MFGSLPLSERTNCFSPLTLSARRESAMKAEMKRLQAQVLDLRVQVSRLELQQVDTPMSSLSITNKANSTAAAAIQVASTSTSTSTNTNRPIMCDQATQVEVLDVPEEQDVVEETDEDESDMEASFFSARSIHSTRKVQAPTSTFTFTSAPTTSTPTSRRQVNSPLQPSSADVGIHLQEIEQEPKDKEEDKSMNATLFENTYNASTSTNTQQQAWVEVLSEQQPATHAVKHTSVEQHENIDWQAGSDNENVPPSPSSSTFTTTFTKAQANTNNTTSATTSPTFENADLDSTIAAPLAATDDEAYRLAGTGKSPLDALPKAMLQDMLYAYWKDRQGEQYMQQDDSRYDTNEETHYAYDPQYDATQQYDEWTTTAEATPTYNYNEERRTDPNDGYAYTIDEFLTHYGGVNEWKLANVWVDYSTLENEVEKRREMEYQHELTPPNENLV